MGYEIPDGALMTTDDRVVGPIAKEGLSVYQGREKARGPSTGRDAERPDVARSLPWSSFVHRHPSYDSDLWEECHALYAGGPALLRNKGLMQRLFPSHRGEDQEIYKERCKRAHYFPYAGSIVDHLVAGLGADPLRLKVEEGESNSTLDPWWSEFMADVSSPGGKTVTCQALMSDLVRDSLTYKTGWVLVDMPGPQGGARFNSLLEQEQAGVLRPYAVRVHPQYVIDWQDDESGELEWALVCDVSTRRNGLSDARGAVTKTFTHYTRDGWERYQITYMPDKPPRMEDPVPLIGEGTHPFSRVPLVRLELPEGLWAMGKLESLSREHMNKRNAAAWAEYKALFSVLYEFLAPEEGTSMMPVSDAQEDPDRAISQVRGQGYSAIRGHQDDARFIGPDVAPFAEARESCAEIMREMHRVMFSMALSANMDSHAIRRSGESKAQDKHHTTVILDALGIRMRDALVVIMDLVAAARGGDAPDVAGAEKFDQLGVSEAVSEAVEVTNGLPIKSPTFEIEYLMRTYRAVMGDELSDSQLDEIRKELEQRVTGDDMMDSVMGMSHGVAVEDVSVDDDDDDDEGHVSAVSDRAEKSPRRRGFSTLPG